MANLFRIYLTCGRHNVTLKQRPFLTLSFQTSKALELVVSNGHQLFLTFRFCLFLRGSSSMLVNKFLVAANSLKSGIRSSAKSRVTISPEKLLLAPKSASSLRNQKSRDMTMNDDESDVSDADSDISIETAVTKYGNNLTGIILPIILYF